MATGSEKWAAIRAAGGLRTGTKASRRAASTAMFNASASAGAPF